MGPQLMLYTITASRRKVGARAGLTRCGRSTRHDTPRTALEVAVVAAVHLRIHLRLLELLLGGALLLLVRLRLLLVCSLLLLLGRSCRVHLLQLLECPCRSVIRAVPGGGTARRSSRHRLRPQHCLRLRSVVVGLMVAISRAAVLLGWLPC